jgi:anti-anti-sigma factor
VTDDAPLNLATAVDNGVARVAIHGELDLDRADEVAGELTALPAQGATSVVIDATALTFIDSSGLRALLTARDQLHAAGATLHIANLTPSVERVLDMTGTRELLTGE